jgi:deoxyribose-phosphate aldolase
MQPEELAKTIDHTLLAPTTTVADVERLCSEAIEYHFATVCVLPWFVPIAHSLVKDADVKVCTVIAFPYGADMTRAKMTSADEVVSKGADEIDVMINLPALLSGQFGAVRDDLASVVRAARLRSVNTGRGHVTVKAIIETCYLTTPLKRLACKICEGAGVDFVKTSTGVGPHGATVPDVELLRDELGEAIGVKASGGIRTVRDVELMINAGAARIGTSAGVSIVRELLAAT